MDIRGSMKWRRCTLGVCMLFSAVLLTSTHIIEATTAFAENDPLAVPTFVIIGVDKGGTTDLYDQITNVFSKQVITPQMKEVFALHVSRDVWLKHRERGFVRYVNLLNHPCAHSQYFVECARDQSMYTIDASPPYYLYPKASHVLRSVSPNTKVILMLREPLSRCESLYNHWKLNSQLQDANRTVDDLALQFLNWTEQPRPKRLLHTILTTRDPLDLEIYYQELLEEGLVSTHENAIFGSGLYVYGLSVWHKNYLSADRTLIIDSGRYFTDRTSVFETVTQFLFGRELMASERNVSAMLAPKNVKLGAGLKAAGSAFSVEVRRQMQLFYEPHMKKLTWLLDGLQREGFWVLGFNTDPWI